MLCIKSRAETGTAMDITSYRKSLIPRWIKVFGWVFIVLSVVVALMLMVYPFFNFPGPPSFYIFGLRYTGSPYSFGAWPIIGIILFLGATSYGLLFAKDWGLYGAMANGYLGLAICVSGMVLTGFAAIQLEPLLQIPYLITLHSIKTRWFNPEEPTNPGGVDGA